MTQAKYFIPCPSSPPLTLEAHTSSKHKLRSFVWFSPFMSVFNLSPHIDLAEGNQSVTIKIILYKLKTLSLCNIYERFLQLA